MGVSRSSFYDSLNRPPSERSKRGDRIRKSLAQVHQETDAIYGATKIAEELKRQSVFNYIEIFYNQRRRHQTLARVSPSEFETDFYNRITKTAETTENRTTLTAV
jgi:hypothetical protein